MNKLQKKQAGLRRRHMRVRGKISGTAQRPRLCITRSNSNLYAQFVDDVAGKTLLGISTLGPDFKATGKSGATVEGAAAMGEIIGKIKAQNAQIYGVDITRGKEQYAQRPSAVFSIRLNQRRAHEQVLTAISELENVTVIDEV